jgi:Secretion system C-terminal sorting domain
MESGYAALRTNLLAQSPNLSTTVLLAVAQLGTLKKQTLMHIFLANPNACREPQFLRKLTRDLPNLLTDADIQQLKNAPRGRSKREELEETVNKNSSKRAEIGKQLVFDLMADSLDQTEKLRYWWGRLESRHAQYKIAETYIKESQSNRYEALLRGLNNDLADSEDLLKENQDYVELYGIKSQILKSGRSLRRLNATEIINIRRIANNTYGNAAVQAKTILCAAIGECKKTEVPRFPLSFETRQIAIGNGGHPNLSPTNDNFRVYPNPTSGNVTIDLNSKAEFTEGSISLLDMTGKIILNQKINDAQKQVVWQTEQLRQGLYFILFKVGNQTVYQTKLSIQK